MRRRHQFARLAAAALTISAALAIPTATEAASQSTGAAREPSSTPLPACRYADVRTRFQSTGQWRHTLVDTELRVTRQYVPPDLVSVSNAHINGSGQVRNLAIDDLRAMARASRDADSPIAVRSAYRSYREQAAVFQMWVDRVGYDKALRTSARPGHSEHQLGTTIDFRSGGSSRAPWDYPDWAKTPAGAWMAENAWKYGWLMSYPKGKSNVSCYDYEPWHYRYYGRELAAKIHHSGKVPRGYLWAHFESRP